MESARIHIVAAYSLVVPSLEASLISKGYIENIKSAAMRKHNNFSAFTTSITSISCEVFKTIKPLFGKKSTNFSEPATIKPSPLVAASTATYQLFKSLQEIFSYGSITIRRSSLDSHRRCDQTGMPFDIKFTLSWSKIHNVWTMSSLRISTTVFG